MERTLKASPRKSLSIEKKRRTEKNTKYKMTIGQNKAEPKGLSEKNKKIIHRVFTQIKILNYLRKPKKTKHKMKKALMHLGLLQNDVEKKVTRKRKEDYFDVENLEDLENIVHKFVESRAEYQAKNRKFRLIVYPNSTFKKIWDLLNVIIMVYICTYFPYRVCFIITLEMQDAGFFIEALIDLIFFLDIIVTFLSAIEIDGTIVDSHREIAVAYLKSWFWTDVISIIPFYLIDMLNTTTVISGTFSIRVLKFLRLLKIFRIFKGNPVFDRLMFNMRLSMVTKQILKNLVYLILFIHIIGCLWYYITNFEPPLNCWLTSVDLYDADLSTKYLTSIYFALVVSFTVGFGDVYPVSDNELIFLIIYIIVGVSLYSYTISNLTSLFGRLSERDNYLHQKENAIREFSINHSLSNELYLEIRNYLIDNDTQQNSFFIERNVISSLRELTDYLPAQLYYELYVNNFREQLMQFLFLKDTTEMFYILFISLFEIKLYNKNDVVYKPGDSADEVYIVWKGKFCMINSMNFESYERYVEKRMITQVNKNSNYSYNNYDKLRRKFREEKLKIMAYFNDHDVFGENDLKKKYGKIRKFTIKAEEDSVVIILKKPDFKYLCECDNNFRKYFEEYSKEKEKVIEMIFDSYRIFQAEDFAFSTNVELYEEFLKLSSNAGNARLKSKDEIIRLIANCKNYTYLQNLLSRVPIKESKTEKEKPSRLNKHANSVREAQKGSLNLSMSAETLEEIKLGESHNIIKDESYSMYELPVIINLENFEHKKLKEIEELNIIKLSRQKKFQIFTAEIFPIIHEMNIKLKKVFSIMRNFIYQFEELRRKTSPTTPDMISKARNSINDSFSVFFEIIEMINKLETADTTETLKIADAITAQCSNFIEGRLQQLMEEREAMKRKWEDS